MPAPKWAARLTYEYSEAKFEFLGEVDDKIWRCRLFKKKKKWIRLFIKIRADYSKYIFAPDKLIPPNDILVLN